MLVQALERSSSARLALVKTACHAMVLAVEAEEARRVLPGDTGVVLNRNRAVEAVNKALGGLVKLSSWGS